MSSICVNNSCLRLLGVPSRRSWTWAESLRRHDTSQAFTANIGHHETPCGFLSIFIARKYTACRLFNMLLKNAYVLTQPTNRARACCLFHRFFIAVLNAEHCVTCTYMHRLHLSKILLTFYFNNFENIYRKR